MDQRTRRGFLRTILGGSIALPAVLRSQSPTAPGPLTPMPADSLRVQDTVPPPRPVITPGSRNDEPHASRGKKRKKEEELALIKPRMLKKGSVIGIVAPASGVVQGEAYDAAATLRNLGFEVKLGRYLTKGFGYLASNDERRADEFMQFVCDPEIDCVMAVRGGYGVMRILPLIDFAEVRANPKAIIGYSDITALVNPVYQKAGVIAFHGPVATSTFDSYTLDSFRRTLMQPVAAGSFDESNEFNGAVFSEARASTVVSGKAQGRLVGGNLTLVTAMMGTPWEIDTEGKILFLEEINEEPYRVDRMLTQLAIGGKLAACAGVALGRFNKCESPSRGGEFQMSLSIEQIVRGILEPLGIPTVYGLSIGHIKSKLTVPIGGLATIDSDAKTITIDEPVVQ